MSLVELLIQYGGPSSDGITQDGRHSVKVTKIYEPSTDPGGWTTWSTTEALVRDACAKCTQYVECAPYFQIQNIQHKDPKAIEVTVSRGDGNSSAFQIALVFGLCEIWARRGKTFAVPETEPSK